MMQLTCWPEVAAQFHTPEPLGVTLVTVRLVGTVSVSVTVPIAAEPAETPLDTESVKLPVPPEATVAVPGVSDSVNDGIADDTVTVAVAGVGVVPPPPVEVRVLVNGEPVADAAV